MFQPGSAFQRALAVRQSLGRDLGQNTPNLPEGPVFLQLIQQTSGHE